MIAKEVKVYLDTNGNTNNNVQIVTPNAIANAKAFINQSLNAGIKTKTDFTAQVAFANNVINVSGSTTFIYDTVFMTLFGIPNVDISVGATSAAEVSKFIQVIFLVDGSGSMGVGATDSDISALNSRFGCSFACHTGLPSSDTRIQAKSFGIKVKFDYAQSAIKKFTEKMSVLAGSSPNHIKAGIYTFSGYLSTTLAATTDFAAVSVAVDNMEMHITDGDEPCAPKNCTGWTYINNALNQVSPKISNVGDGTSAASMLTYLIFVSDGISDEYGNGNCCGHATGTSWFSACTQLKQKGIQVATIQAVYPNMNEWFYYTLVAPYVPSAPGAFSACASSSSLVLSASDGPGLETAINSLFPQIFGSIRITK